MYTIKLDRIPDDGLAVGEWVANAFPADAKEGAAFIATESGATIPEVLAGIAEQLTARETKKAFAKVHWTVEDVHAARSWHAPNTLPPISYAEAEEFLANIEQRIADKMVQAGWAVVEEELA